MTKTTPRKIRMILDGHVAGGDDDSHVGDTIVIPKPEGFVRAMGVQSNRLPAFARMEKSKNTFKAVKKYEADVVMMGEVSLNMPN